MDLQQKFTEAKQKASEVYTKVKIKTLEVGKKATDWFIEDPIGAVTIIGGVAGVALKGKRKYDNYKLEHLHDKEIYDESLHMYHPVKRKLTYNEELYYRQQVRSGRNGVDVLKELRLYKG